MSEKHYALQKKTKITNDFNKYVIVGCCVLKELFCKSSFSISFSDIRRKQMVRNGRVGTKLSTIEETDIRQTFGHRRLSFSLISRFLHFQNFQSL